MVSCPLLVIEQVVDGSTSDPTEVLRGKTKTAKGGWGFLGASKEPDVHAAQPLDLPWGASSSGSWPCLLHLLLAPMEFFSMPGRGRNLGAILGEVGPEQFHGLEGQREFHCHCEHACSSAMRGLEVD